MYVHAHQFKKTSIQFQQILRRGANINDRDGLTDMTLLHYASKSGAAGIGSPDLAAEVSSMLIGKGADLYVRCRWTNMTALHYAAYFDVVPVIKVLLKATKALGMFLSRILYPSKPWYLHKKIMVEVETINSNFTFMIFMIITPLDSKFKNYSFSLR